MSKLMVVFFCVILTLLFFACKAEQQAETEMQEQEQVTTVEPDTTQVTCPACGMTMAKADMVTYDVDGETYHFCSEGCRDQYLADLEENIEVEDSDTEEE